MVGRDRLETFLTTESLFNDSWFGSILNPFKTRTEKLAESLDAKLFKKATLKDLANAPRVYINATNVGTGHAFTFAAGASGKCEVGEYELGYVQKPDWNLARAVAASSAIPVGFVPLRVETEEYRLPAPYSYTALIDGGVYDNLGINPLLRKEADIDLIIVSDAGFPYRYEAEPTESGLLVVRNTIDIMMEQIRTLQFERLISRWNAKTGPRPIWFSIDSESGEEKPGDAKAAAAIPTSFAKLETNQLTVIKRHGAALVEERLRKYAGEVIGKR